MSSEEEKKKREEEAKIIINSSSIGDTINSINYANSNNLKINTQNEDEQNFINKVNEANDIINSINPRQNVSAPTSSEEDRKKSQQNAQKFLDLMDGNVATESESQYFNENTAENTQVQSSQESLTDDVDVQEVEETTNNTITQEQQKQNFESYINAKKDSMQTVSNAIQQNAQAQEEAKQENKTLIEQANQAFRSQYPATVNTQQEQTNSTSKPEFKIADTSEIKDLKVMSSGDMFKLTDGQIDDRSNIQKTVDEVLGNLGNFAMGIESVVPSTVKYIDAAGETATKKASEKILSLLFHTDETTSEIIGEQVFSKLWEFNELAKINNELNSDELKNWRKQTIAKNISKTSTPLGKKLAEITPSVGQNIVPMVISYFNPPAGTALFMTSAAGSYLEDAEERGMNKDQSLAYATVMGTFEGATEEVISGKMLSNSMKLFGGVGLSEEVLNSFGVSTAENFLQEAIMEPLQETTAQVIGGKDKANWDDILNRSLEAGVDGILSAILLNGASVGIASANNVINKKNPTQQEIQTALADTINSGKVDINDIVNGATEAIKENKFYINTENFFINETTADRETTNIKETEGIRIDLVNDKLNVTPAVVKDGNSFIVIDIETGLKLDTSNYTSQTEAIKGFDDKIRNIDNATINNINNQITQSKLTLINKIQQLENAPQAIHDFQIQNNQKEYTKKQFDDITKTISQISDKSVYNGGAIINTLRTVSNNVENVNLIEQSGNYYLNSLNENGQVTYQQKIGNRPYTGKKIKEIVNNAIQNADTSNINISQSTNTDIAQTSSQEDTANLQSKETSYTTQDIQKIIEPFNSQEEYTKNEMAKIWNEEINANDLDVLYDNDGNIHNYIAFEEDGDKIYTNLYDSNDNLVKREVIPSENGKYTAETIKNTIEKVANVYDENKSIKETVDIEGNEVSKMKKASNKNYNNFKELIIQEEKNAISNFNPMIDIVVSKDIQDIRLKDIKQSEAIKIAKNIFKENNNKKTFKNQETGNKIKVIADDIKESIHKTFTNKSQKKYLRESIATFSKIDSIIENGKKVSESSELKSRSKYKNWNYYITQAVINEKPFLIEFDAALEEDGWHFRVERLKEINKKVDTPLATTKKSMPIQGKSTSINNSISQKTETVKSDTAINKSMQKSENYTEQKQIQKELHNRIQNAILSKNSRKNTFLGNVAEKVANKIKKLYGIDVTGRRHMVSDYDIRHIIKQHGNPIIEQSKGQIAVTSKDIEKIPDIINNFDKILKGTPNIDTRTGKEFNTIRYVKTYNDNTSYVVEVIPSNNNQLNVKTMWKKPIQINKKNNSIGVNHGYHDAKALHYTSETKSNSSYSDTSIPQNMENVKDDGVRSMKKSNKLKEITNTNPISKDDIRFAKRTAKNQNENIDTTQRNAERQGAYIEQEIQKIEKTGNWDNSIPVTKMTDIRKTIEDYLGLGIKKGHFREQAYAIYKGNRDVIRTKEYKDMDSILHETGHALDIGNRLNIDKESIANELLTAIDKLGGYEQETREIRLEEGFAEVIREYTIVPDQAKVDYPQTVSVIEQIKQNDKSFNNFITKVQEQTYNYIHQNPRNRTLSNMSIGEQTDKAPLTKNWLKQEIMRNIYDKDYALKSAVNELAKAGGKTANSIKASENAYLLTRLTNGISEKVTSMLADGYIDENGNKLMPGLNQIGEILNNDSQKFDDLRAYLVAQRDIEYKAKSLKTGIRSMDSKAVIEQFQNDTQIQQAAKLVYDTLDGVMQYAVNNGLITQETVENLKESNAFYVPMQRVLENKGNQVGRRGAVSDIIKRRTGSELDIKDVLENIVANSSNVIQQVENNNVLKAFYKQGEGSGLTGAIYDVIDTPMTKIGTAQLSTWEAELKKQGVNTAELDLEKTIDLFVPNNKVDSKNLITSFIDDNGKRVYLQFNDEILFNSLMNMDKKFMSQVLKINSKMNMPLRYGATMANIGFAIPNMISDTAQAAIYSTAGFIPVVDNALGVLDILATTNKTVGNFVSKVAPEYANRINALYTIYQQSGATSSTRLSQYRKSSQSIMKDVYGTKKSENLGIKESFKPLKRLLDLMTYIPEISEQSTRFEVFKKNYDYYTKKGNSEMDARIMAAIESRDATQDFGRTGNITREINQLIPFSAARVGSIYTFAEKVSANPKQVGIRIAVLTTLAMAIKGLGYDDDEIEELNQRKKDDNFILKVGDSVVTIKKPQGILRSMINLTEYIQDLATGHIEDGKEGERLGEWLNNAIMDNMPADSITGLVPNMVAPLIENAINKDFYYNTDIVNSYDLDLPDKDQYYEYNSQLAIWLGSIFNYSPAKIDNLISGYFGGLGTQVTSIMDSMLGKAGIIAEKADMGAETDAVGKRFIVNVNSNSASVDEIYTRQEELTKKKNGGTITDEETTELETITDAISNMSKLNKQIKEIKKDSSLSGTEKAEEIKLLQQQRTDTARQALGKNLIYSSNASKIQSTQFYPTSSTLSKNNYVLTLTSDMKKEYEELANEYYSKYESQGIYSEEKLADLKSKAKDYAKNQLMQKYKSSLVKNK